jgi:hypothetical protein
MNYLADTSRIRRIILDETLSRRSLENSVWLTLQNRYPKDSLQISKSNIVGAIRRSTDSDLNKILLKRDF